jgi:hypothetical protein
MMCRIMLKIVAGEGDQLGDLSTLPEPGVVDDGLWYQDEGGELHTMNLN